MKMHGKLSKILLTAFISLGVLYLVFLYALPPFLSSLFFKDLVDDYIYAKTGIEITSERLNVKTKPDISIIIGADKIDFDINGEELLKAENLTISYNLLSRMLEKIDIKYIYVNEAGFKDIIKSSKKKKTFKLKFTKHPEINVKNAEIWLDKGTTNSTFIMINDLHQYIKDNKLYFDFKADITSNLLKNPVNIGRQGNLYYKKNNLYADNFQVLIGESELTLNGKILDKKHRGPKLNITGSDIPISDIMLSLLYFQQLKEPGKKFIENFYNYSGTLDVNVKLNSNGVFGKCTADMLAGKSVLFDVPILFPKVDFLFKERNMKAAAYGTLGGEKVFSSVEVSDMATGNHRVKGYVHSNLTNDTVHKYMKNVTVKGIADASVSYEIENKIVDVKYLLKLSKGSDIYYKSSNLGLEDKDRRLFVNTVKNKDELRITDYDYSTQEAGEISKIILGDGLFKKENGSFKPQYLTFKTQNDAPVSVTGSFYKYVEGGFFNGNLKYDFKNNIITGVFNIKNSRYKNFKIKNAMVDATTKNVRIEANGLYKKSPFECKINALNKFSNKIKIFDMYLFLDEFVINKQNRNVQKSSIDTNKIIQKAKQYDVDIDKWTIKINKIKRRKLEINKIVVTGDIHNSIFKFIVQPFSFAKGTINANGVYNYANSSSDVMINAEKIDSNTAADVVFELPDQIEGLANATINAKTNNGLDDVKAKINFSIEKGFLPKLGNTEFLIKKSRMIRHPFKVKLSDVVNIDFNDMNELCSNLKGEFDYDNLKIKNANITASQKYLAMLIQGDYNIVKEQADFRILGKYNKDKIRKIKVFFVPLSWIVNIVFRNEKSYEQYKNELSKIPKIDADSEDECAFRINVKGNINTNDIKVEHKRIK